MPASIFYDKRIATVFAATNSAVGFPASNGANESLARPWKSTGNGAVDYTITFPSNVGIHSFCLHDVNFATATIRKSADGSSFSTVGTMTTYADRDARRRGRILVNDASVKAMQVQIGAGSSTDGAVWRIGAPYPYGSSQVVPADLNFPVNEDVVTPAIAQDLPNGLTGEAVLGTRYSRIDTVWNREATESLSTLIPKARAATIWFDCGTSDYPEQQWPVFLLSRDRMRETFDKFRFSRPALTFTERA